MMTIRDIGLMMEVLEANYGQKFYDGVNKDNVIVLWQKMFADDDPKEVMKGVLNCVNTMPYKPTIADIRQRMAQSKMAGQMTELEAFQTISKAVDDATSKDEAVKAFTALPPVLRKLVSSPSWLRKWRTVSEESFNTVVMSQIVRSYRELAKWEADYHALPKQLQELEQWRIESPSLDGLPEPVEKTVDEIIEESNAKAAEHRVMTPELKEKHRERVEDFLTPMSEKEKKRIEEKQVKDWSKEK